MYAEFFGLSELPFNNTPDPRFFYATPDHEEALASMIYAVSAAKGFMLLTGEVGAGKTLLTKMVLRHFGQRICAATIHYTVLSARDLLACVCDEFGVPVPEQAGTATCVRVLHDFLLAQYAHNVPVVLMIDEAQALTRESFEQLRMLGNLEHDSAKLLQILIVGQPELRRVFLSSEMRQLRQRVFRIFHLPPLTRALCDGYIRHRLDLAGASGRVIFKTSAVEVVHRHTQGLPRLINTVCDNAMLSAYSADLPTIDGEFVESVIAQMLTLDPPRVPSEEPLGERVLCPALAAPEPRASARAPVSALENQAVFNERLERVESQFAGLTSEQQTTDARLAGLLHQMDAKLAGVQQTSDGRFANVTRHVDDQLAAARRTADTRFAELAQQTDQKLAAAQRTSEARLADLVHGMDATLAVVQGTADTRFADFARQMEDQLTAARRTADTRLAELAQQTDDKLATVQQTTHTRFVDLARQTDEKTASVLQHAKEEVRAGLKRIEDTAAEAAGSVEQRLAVQADRTQCLWQRLPEMAVSSDRRDQQMRRLTALVQRLEKELGSYRSEAEGPGSNHEPASRREAPPGAVRGEESAPRASPSVAAVSQRLKELVRRTRTSMGDLGTLLADAAMPVVGAPALRRIAFPLRFESPVAALASEVQRLSDLAASLP